MANSDLVFKSGRELAALIKSRQVSPVEVAQAYLDRIEALNPKLNAYITVTRDFALARAREAEKEIGAGKYRGPLHGLPYAAKDIVATKGIRTTNASKTTADWVPDYESTITTRLNNAGAILLGKTNLVEFAMGSGVLSGFGQVRNPWALDYSPAGSSSGSAVALAAYLAPLTVGTDTTGSIRAPANACGIVGLKQTYGRVSRFGVSTVSWTLDTAGPMTKTVADAAMMLQAMAGSDPKDPTASYDPVPDYPKSLTQSIKGLRIGMPANYFFDDIHPETVKAVHAAAARLKDMGASVVEVNVPHAELGQMGGAIWIITMAEAAAYHESRLKHKAELFDPIVRERCETAKFYSATDYIKAQRIRTVLMDGMRQVFEKCDVLATPAGNPATKIESAATAGTDVKPGPAIPRRGTTSYGSLTGIPAIVIPCGFTSTRPTLPLAIQFYAKPFDETTLFRVSHAYESITDWHKRRPPVA